jgi:hypothetical protein
MGRRARSAGLAGLTAAAVHAALVGIWLALDQEAEEAVGYTAWFLSLPLLSVTVGLLVGRPWALALVAIPALATSRFWGVGCDGDDLCFGEMVLWLLLPLCSLGISLGLLVRRTGPLFRQALPPRARAVARRARSTPEERPPRRTVTPAPLSYVDSAEAPLRGGRLSRARQRRPEQRLHAAVSTHVEGVCATPSMRSNSLDQTA